MSDLPYSDPSNPALPSPLFSDVTAVRGDHMRANNAAIFADLIELNSRNPERVALTGGSFKTAALANANTYNGRSFFTCTAGVSDTPSAGVWRIFGFWNPADSSGRFVAMADTSLETWEINYSGAAWGTWKQRVDSSGNFTGILETGLVLTDNTTGNVSATAHGFAPKLPNDGMKYFNGLGGYTDPNKVLPVLKTSDFSIDPADGHGLYLIDPSAGNVTGSLPPSADNIGLVIRCTVIATGGSFILDGYGSETIDGRTGITLNRIYDYIEVIAVGAGWIVRSGRASYSVGNINTNDWTDRELGDMSIIYDNKTGTFTVGEEIEEYTTGGSPPTGPTGNKWVICADTGTVLQCNEARGVGFATNDRWIVGTTSGAKAQVNGTSKNFNGSVIHKLGYYPEELDIQVWVGASAGARTYKIVPGATPIGVADGGVGFISGTLNSFKVKTATSGFYIIQDDGTRLVINNQDWYYNILVVKRW